LAARLDPVKEEIVEPADTGGVSSPLLPLLALLPPPDLRIRQPRVRLKRLEIHVKNGVLSSSSPLPLEITHLELASKGNSTSSSTTLCDNSKTTKPRRKTAGKPPISVSPEPVPLKLRISLGGGVSAVKQRPPRRRQRPLAEEEADSCSGESSGSESDAAPTTLNVPRQYIVPASSGEDSSSTDDSDPETEVPAAAAVPPPSKANNAVHDESSCSSGENSDRDRRSSGSREATMAAHDNNRYTVTFVEGPDAGGGSGDVASDADDSSADAAVAASLALHASTVDPATSVAEADSKAAHSKNLDNNIPTLECTGDTRSEVALNINPERCQAAKGEHVLEKNLSETISTLPETGNVVSVRKSVDIESLLSEKTGASVGFCDTFSLGILSEEEENYSDSDVNIGDELEKTLGLSETEAASSSDKKISNVTNSIASFIATELPLVLGNIHNALRDPQVQNKVQ
jgi:hypothetical protein